MESDELKSFKAHFAIYMSYVGLKYEGSDILRVRFLSEGGGNNLTEVVGLVKNGELTEVAPGKHIGYLS